MPELSMLGWMLAVLASMAVGLNKGGVAMIGAVAVPLLSLVMSPVTAAGLLLPVYIAGDAGALIAYRRSFNGAILRSVLPGAVIAIGLGWATAHIVPVWGVTLLVGLIGLSFSLNALFKPSLAGSPRQPTLTRGSFWGAIAGYTSFVSHAGAPPFQVYVQPMQLPTLVYAGTAAWFFAGINLVKLIPYAALGQLSPDNLRVAATLIPVSIFSVWLGTKLLKIIPQALFYKLITWGLLIISLRLIWQALMG